MARYLDAFLRHTFNSEMDFTCENLLLTSKFLLNSNKRLLRQHIHKQLKLRFYKSPTFDLLDKSDFLTLYSKCT